MNVLKARWGSSETFNFLTNVENVESLDDLVNFPQERISVIPNPLLFDHMQAIGCMLSNNQQVVKNYLMEHGFLTENDHNSIGTDDHDVENVVDVVQNVPSIENDIAGIPGILYCQKGRFFNSITEVIMVKVADIEIANTIPNKFPSSPHLPVIVMLAGESEAPSVLQRLTLIEYSESGGVQAQVKEEMESLNLGSSTATEGVDVAHSKQIAESVLIKYGVKLMAQHFNISAIIPQVVPKEDGDGKLNLGITIHIDDVNRTWSIAGSKIAQSNTDVTEENPPQECYQWSMCLRRQHEQNSDGHDDFDFEQDWDDESRFYSSNADKLLAMIFTIARDIYDNSTSIHDKIVLNCVLGVLREYHPRSLGELLEVAPAKLLELFLRILIGIEGISSQALWSGQIISILEAALGLGNAEVEESEMVEVDP